MKALIIGLGFSFLLFSDNSPKVEWLSGTTHDFGDLKQGTPVFFNFKFKNIDNETLVIDTARPTCGCTVPEWTETPIAPDSIGILKIKFDAKKMGYFRKKIMVFVSGQRKCEKIYIEGDVVD